MSLNIADFFLYVVLCNCRIFRKIFTEISSPRRKFSRIMFF